MRYSSKGHKRFGVFCTVMGSVVSFLGLLLMLAVPPVGLLAVLFGLFYIFLGRKHLKKASKKPKQQKPETNFVVSTEKDIESAVEETIEQSQVASETITENTLVEKEKERLAKCVYDYVVIDFETTGFNPPNLEHTRFDEVLSVSIIDQDGNTLLNSLCKPEVRKTWKKAEAVNGITPAMVKDKPTFRELFPTIKGILQKSKYVIAYNIAFEYKFLMSFDCAFGFPGEGKIRETVVWGADPMLMYCAYKAIERWQNLTTVARHFKYNFEAHDSLEDVKATLHCYKKLLEYVKENPDKEYIIRYGYLYDADNIIKGKWLDMNTGEILDETLIK